MWADRNISMYLDSIAFHATTAWMHNVPPKSWSLKVAFISYQK